MKRLLLIIPLILAVLVYAGFRTGGYRSGRTTIAGETQFDGKVIFNDVSAWMYDDSLFFTDGGADTSWIVQSGTGFELGSDNAVYIMGNRFQFSTTTFNPVTDTSRSVGSAVLRYKEIWPFRLRITSPDDADSLTISDDGTNAIINADNPLAINTSVNYAADAQSDDDYEVAIPGITALVAGLTVTFKANTANTDGATLEITSVGDQDAILKLHDTALATNDIKAGAIVVVVFDGSDWQMTSQLSQ